MAIKYNESKDPMNYQSIIPPHTRKAAWEANIPILIFLALFLLLPLVCFEISEKAKVFLHFRNTVDAPLPRLNVTVQEGNGPYWTAANNRNVNDSKEVIVFNGTTDSEGVISFAVARKDQNLKIIVQRSASTYQTRITITRNQVRGNAAQIFITLPDLSQSPESADTSQ